MSGPLLGRPDGPPTEDGGADRADGSGRARRALPQAVQRLAPRNWRVRSKLIAVLLVPALAFLVIAGINIAGQVGSARDYDEGRRLAEFGRQVTALAHELQTERDLTNGFMAAGRPKPVTQKAINEVVTQRQKITVHNADPKNRDNPLPLPALPHLNSADLLATGRQNVNSAVGSYRAADDKLGNGLGDQVQTRVDDVRTQLDGLRQLRLWVDNKNLVAGAVINNYNRLITSLLQIDREIGQLGGSRELNQQVATLNALSDLKEVTSQERGLLYAIVSAGGYRSVQDQRDLVAAVARQSAAFERFRQEAEPGQQTLYDKTVSGQAVIASGEMEQKAIDRQLAPNIGLDAQQWYQASTTRIQLLRQVEGSLLDGVVKQARALRAEAERTAVTTGLLILAILVAALVTSVLIARSMIQPLRQLRTSAMDVAENRLPRAIERLRASDAPPPEEVEPIAVDSRDEIGEVARTFDAIHREAIRLATEQAALRSNVNAMFVNLSRRSQSLVERQLKLIDELETGEQDPDQLANLFKLDHLATRMRRNSENLLVLAGEDAGRRWGRPIPLVDVLRAATSEVEQYHRVQLTGVPDVEVMGHAVNHLVHLVAELLENATVFSSPESKVLVHSQRLSDGGAMIEIEDRGIGMTAQEIMDSNERLAKPPVFDVSISRMMGLYVVGRLSSRHGITVRLRQSELGGVSAFVRVPSDVLVSRFDHDEPTEVRPATPALPAPGEAAPARTAGARSGSIGDLPRRELPANNGFGAFGAGGRAALPASEEDVSGSVAAATGAHERPQVPRPSTALPRRTAGDNGSPAVPGLGPDSGPVPRPTGPGSGPVSIPRLGPDSGAVPAAPATSAAPTASSGGVPATPPSTPPGPPTGADDGPRAGRPMPKLTSLGRGPRSGQPSTPHTPPRGTPAAPPSSSTPSGDVPTTRPAQPSPSAQGRSGEDPANPEGTPIFEQLQSEWFRRRPSGQRAAAPPAAPPDAPTPPRRPLIGPPTSVPLTAVPPPIPTAQPAPITSPTQRTQPSTAGSTRPHLPGAPGALRPPQAPGTPPVAEEPWQSPADEGWRAAERLAAPTTGGTTRAGLPVRVPQAHLVPGAAESQPAAPQTPPTAAERAYRSPEAVRSRLSSYTQGVRRGRHAEVRDDRADRDPSDLVQTHQEPS